MSSLGMASQKCSTSKERSMILRWTSTITFFHCHPVEKQWHLHHLAIVILYHCNWLSEREDIISGRYEFEYPMSARNEIGLHSALRSRSGILWTSKWSYIGSWSSTWFLLLLQTDISMYKYFASFDVLRRTAPAASSHNHGDLFFRLPLGTAADVAVATAVVSALLFWSIFQTGWTGFSSPDSGCKPLPLGFFLMFHRSSFLLFVGGMSTVST